MVKTLITKGALARRKQRSNACISKWIKTGKISRAALIGEGGGAKVWLEQAERDLAASLDPAQQLIQRVPILPAPVAADDPPEAPTTPTTAGAAAAPRNAGVAAEREADLARRAKADADRAEQEAIAAARKNAVEAGRWVEAEEAARVWQRELQKLIAETETFLVTTLARELAGNHGLEWKAVSIEIRELFRKHRMALSEDAARRAADAVASAPPLADAAE